MLSAVALLLTSACSGDDDGSAHPYGVQTGAIGESLADEHVETPDLQIHSTEVEHLVREWIKMLSDKQRLVIRHRYGIDECELLTLEELALRLELTRERVRQIQEEALKRLRRLSKQDQASA